MRPRRPALVAVAAAAVLTAGVAAVVQDAPPIRVTAPPPTDPALLRSALVVGGGPVRTDVDGDGDPDVVEAWSGDHRTRWFDEDDDLAAGAVRGDDDSDLLQVDRDGDGAYDGPDDLSLDRLDEDRDGDLDLEALVVHPRAGDDPYGGDAHWWVAVDVDDDGGGVFVDPETFEVDAWRLVDGSAWAPDYDGDALFLKEHVSPQDLRDPRLSWENPFAFYDPDDDGFSEVAVRLVDDRLVDGRVSDFDGRYDEAFVSWDLDGDSGPGSATDYDLSLRVSSRDGGTPVVYRDAVQEHAGLRAPDWVLPYLRVQSWRLLDELVHASHDDALDVALGHDGWGSTWLTVDEDDDDHRWERVELYEPADPYSTARWAAGTRDGGMSGHPQADSLGDRGEWDADSSGGGRLYVGAWDGRLHLHGAERGAWTVDEGARFWGSGPVVPRGSSPEQAERVGEVVQYEDTDGNGFFDRVTYDVDGDRAVDRELDLRGDDVAELVDPAELGWAGLSALQRRLADDAWADGVALHRAAVERGLVAGPEPTASTTAQRALVGHRVSEQVVRALDARLAGADREALRRSVARGDTAAVLELLRRL